MRWKNIVADKFRSFIISRNFISFKRFQTIIGRILLPLLTAGIALCPVTPASARVSGLCVNCHTMHNSQDGNVLNAAGPNEYLLKGGADACVGCHSSDDNTTIKEIGGSRIPIVNCTAEPTYPSTGSSSSCLAAGNFYWAVNNGDAYGHNCLSIPGMTADEALADGAPGMPDATKNSSNCAGCHKRIDGCTSCHLPGHHANDESEVFVTKDGGGYRFLSSSYHDGVWVKGIEDSDWEQTVSSTDHNEYNGCRNMMESNPDSMSDYCGGCHVKFHHLQYTDSDGSVSPDGTSPWYLHPTSLPLPTDDNKDYRLYNTPDGNAIGPYSPESPVARDPDTIAEMPDSSSVVTAGSDQVFCLSCHRVHGSPYPDILRWDYTKMIAANPAPEDQGHGCFVCHVSKDQ